MQGSLFNELPESLPTGPPEADNGLSLAALQESTHLCRKCLLAETRKSVVFGEGNPNAKLVVIGEAPGADEDAQGRPFVGRSGQLLDKILLAAGFERNDVYICNILKCRPPGNRNPMEEEIRHCMPWLEQQLTILQPQVILLLGKVAANTMLQNRLSLGSMRGKPIAWKTSTCFVTYHPAALLRNPHWKRGCWDDIQCMMRCYASLTHEKKQPDGA